jgi:endogenous inhibitor of DNA gyrase (YacG/DUF329 family)
MKNIGGLTFKNIKLREDYEQNKVKCVCCGNDIPYEKRKNKFCSSVCSGKVINLGRVASKDHREKISQIMRKKVKDGELPTAFKSIEKTKRNCEICQKEFDLSHRTSKRKFCSRECAVKNPKCGGYRRGSGRGKKGWYKGYWCDSSWELAWVIYSLDNGLNFSRNTRGFEYAFEGKQRKYYPDYLMEDETYVEVKGYETEQWKSKLSQFFGRLSVLGENEMKPILDYVVEKYGKDFVRLYEKKTETA